jgi:hypothetical protein
MSNPRPSPEGELRFHQPSGAFGALGCSAIFLLIPAIGAIGLGFDEGGPVVGWSVVGGVLLVFMGIYAFFNVDATAILDVQGLRLTRQRRFLFLRGAEKVEWKIPASKLTRAREVTYHRPGRDGGWTKSVKLHLTDGVVLEPALLGGEHHDHAAYRKLVVELERRLGSAFERVQDFGPLGQRPAGEPPPKA